MGDVTTYYFSAADATGAMPVQVEAGGETRMPDIRMLRVPLVRVSGKLAGDSGGRRISVSLVPKGGGPPELLANKTANVQQADGSFELRGVAPGSYTLTAMSSDFLTLLGAQPVQVGEENIEGIVLQFSAGGDLSGVAAIEGRSSANLEGTLVMLQPRDYEGLNSPRGYADKGASSR
jgi:hypothetical protein